MSDMSAAENLRNYPLLLSALPVSWVLTNLANISVDIKPGFASGKYDSGGSGVPHLRPMNIDRRGEIDLAVVKSVADNKGCSLLAGDVLFNNTNSAELVGKTAVIASREVGFAFSNHMTRVRLNADISSKYVARQLHFLWMSGYMRSQCTNHVNQASISSGVLAERVPVLLPPADEQVRIADKLDELLSDIEVGVNAIHAAHKASILYRRSLLKAAVEGGLTADWRRSNPVSINAEDSLRQILVERRSRWGTREKERFEREGKAPPPSWQKRYKEPKELDVDSLGKLPQGWFWASLEQLIVSIRSGTAETSMREPSGFPVLKSSAVRQGSIDFSALNYLRAEQSGQSDNYVKVGDLFITRLSGSVEYVGCCARVEEEPAASLQYPDRIFCVKPAFDSDDLADFIVMCFQAPLVRGRIEAAAKSTAGHKRISISDLLGLPIPVPPAAELKEICREVKAALEGAKDMGKAIDRSLRTAAAQRQNILRAAFSGQLVPQDPSDEPASVLLERIRAERAAAPKKATRGRKGARAAEVGQEAG